MANFNLNKVILGGRLTSDVELKQTQSGVPVCSFKIAVNRRYSPEGAETDFIPCKAWKNTAETICRYFRKGSSICVIGSIQTGSWTDNTGKKRYTTEVVVDEVKFVDSKPEAPGAESPYIPESYTPQNTPNLEPITDDENLPF